MSVSDETGQSTVDELQTAVLAGKGGGVTLPVYTFDQIAYQLTDGAHEADGYGRYSFDIEPGGSVDVNITALTAQGQQLATWAMQAWTAVSGITFNYIKGNGADITFDDTEDGAYANTWFSGDQITHSDVNISVDWIADYGFTMDTYSLQTYIHEIGHALGLGHAGNYNGSADYGVDNLYKNDSWQATVMSYFSQEENTFIDASYAYVITPMIADILAIRDLYGVVAINEGDDIYDFESDFDGDSVARTIVDTGGTDTLDASWTGADQIINLNAETYSDIGGLVGNLGIARGTLIENANGGSGDDTIIGNEADNVIKGMGGSDLIIGGGGNDTILGGGGSDTVVYLGLAADYQVTDNGNGSYVVTSLLSDEGADTLTGVEYIQFSDGLYVPGQEPTNHAPVLAFELEDLSISAATYFEFSVPDGTFVDVDGDGMTYSAQLENGDELPSWLTFDASTMTFYGTPDGDASTLSIKVTASDGTASTSDIFGLKVQSAYWAPSAVDDIAMMGESGPVTVDVLWNDEASDLLDITGVSVSSKNASVKINADNELVVKYKGADLAMGDTAQIDISYTISDGKKSDVGHLTVTVMGERRPGEDIVGDNDFNFLEGTQYGEVIKGLGGSDTILGYAGVDRIDGGKGDDLLDGGADADVFVFTRKSGHDTIVNFSLDDGDRIDLSGISGVTSFKDLMRNHVSFDGDDTIITLSGSDDIVLEDFGSKLVKGDFLL